MMKDDATITRIRQARHDISKRCGHDPKKVVGYYLKLQEKFRGRLLIEDEGPDLPMPQTDALKSSRDKQR